MWTILRSVSRCALSHVSWRNALWKVLRINGTPALSTQSHAPQLPICGWLHAPRGMYEGVHVCGGAKTARAEGVHACLWKCVGVSVKIGGLVVSRVCMCVWKCVHVIVSRVLCNMCVRNVCVHGCVRARGSCEEVVRGGVCSRFHTPRGKPWVTRPPHRCVRVCVRTCVCARTTHIKCMCVCVCLGFSVRVVERRPGLTVRHTGNQWVHKCG